VVTADEIAGVSIFAALDAVERERLSRNAADIRLVPGEYAVHQGDERALFAVLEGRLETVGLVDGIPSVLHPGRPFAIPWPRSAVRRGSATIGKKAGGVAWETLECLGDSVRVSFAADAVPAVKLEMDGAAHPVLEIEFDEPSGHGRVIGYPALRSQQRLTIEGRGAEPVEVDLP